MSMVRFIWDGEHGLIESAKVDKLRVIPPIDSQVICRLGDQPAIGTVIEVAVDYLRDEIVIHLKDVELR